MNKIRNILSVSDLKSEAWVEAIGSAHEHSADRFFSVDEMDSSTTIQTSCRSISRYIQDSGIQLLEPISVHELCPVDLSRKPARHRSVSAIARKSALRFWNSRACGTQYFGRCQSTPRLAYGRLIFICLFHRLFDPTLSF